MKNILCFGDSNTYGYNALGKRFDRRWTRELASLVDDYVIEEGLGGRTASSEDGIMENLCGYKTIGISIRSHLPLDLVVIMLGTNDLKNRLNRNPSDIAQGLERCIKLIRYIAKDTETPCPKILLVATTKINEGIYNCEFGDMFGQEAIKKSEQLPKYIEDLAKKYGEHFLDANDFIESWKVDGIHIDEEGHIKLANAIANKIKEIL